MMKNILEHLERTTARVPNSIAFFDDEQAMTFAQLLGRARSIGTCLSNLVGVRGVVAVLMDGRDMACIPAFMGVLYAGGAYAPLDPAMPAERLALILSLLSPDAILTDDKGDKALKALGEGKWRVVYCQEAVKTAQDEPALSVIRDRCSIYDPLSILFTSGSTGIPKGSVQSHFSYIHYTDATIKAYGFDDKVVFGSQSPFFYANAIIDIFPPIALGASVYLLPKNALAFPKRFVACLRESHVAELTMTPSSFIAIANAEVLKGGILPELKWGIMSGERMPYRPLKMWMEAAPNADFYNFYGSTEAFSVAVGKVEGVWADGDLLPVGKPFPQAHILFVDETGQEALPTQGGEMYVSTPWMSAGYHRDAERTNEAYLIDPMGRGYFERFFRTGDMGRLDDKGRLTVLGRRDAQVKHHGYRMELGELEAALRALKKWQDGCVVFHDGLIYCFFTGDITQKEIQAGLKAKLPRYMLPDGYKHLKALPYTATMKVDRMMLRKTHMLDIKVKDG